MTDGWTLRKYLTRRKAIKKLPSGFYQFINAQLDVARDNYQEARFNPTEHSQEYYRGQMSAWATMLNRLDEE